MKQRTKNQIKGGLAYAGRANSWVTAIFGTIGSIILFVFAGIHSSDSLPPSLGPRAQQVQNGTVSAMIVIGVLLLLGVWLNLYFARKSNSYATFLGGLWALNLFLPRHR